MKSLAYVGGYGQTISRIGKTFHLAGARRAIHPSTCPPTARRRSGMAGWMSRAPLPTTLLACPRCHGDLEDGPTEVRCPACGAPYPDLGQVPCVLRDRTAASSRWREQLAGFARMVAAAVARLDVDLEHPGLLDTTRARLEATRRGTLDNGQAILSLFADAGLGLTIDVAEAAEALDGSLIDHFEFLLRDWGWTAVGTGENERAVQAIADALAGFATGARVAVLGAGACRLAYDLHRTVAPSVTLAIDLDPLILLSARRVLFEDGLAVTELPLVPDDGSRIAIRHHLRAPQPPGDGFHLLLADVLEQPLRDESVDLCVTPWFVDAARADMADLIAAVHRVLVPGGRWVNHGPLVYTPHHPARQRYAPEEIEALLVRAGFTVRRWGSGRMEHLVSPFSGHARLERVWTFLVEKQPA